MKQERFSCDKRDQFGRSICPPHPHHLHAHKKNVHADLAALRWHGGTNEFLPNRKVPARHTSRNKDYYSKKFRQRVAPKYKKKTEEGRVESEEFARLMDDVDRRRAKMDERKARTRVEEPTYDREAWDAPERNMQPSRCWNGARLRRLRLRARSSRSEKNHVVKRFVLKKLKPRAKPKEATITAGAE